jgi:hypothetical protein
MDVILDRDPEPDDNVKRPLAITIVCVLEVSVLVLFGVYAIVMHSRMIIDGFLFYNVIRTVLKAGLAIGMWQMKKVAAYAFIGVVVLNQILLLRIDRWTMQAFVFPVIMLVLVLSRIERMK